MPRIPTFESTTRSSTAVGSVSPSQIGQLGQSISADLNRIALVQQRIAEEEQRQRDSAHMSRSLLVAEESLAKLYSQAVESENFEQSLPIFQEQTSALGDRIVSSFANEEDRARFALQFSQRRTSLQMQIANHTRRLRVAGQRDDFKNLEDQTARSLSLIPVEDDVARSTLLSQFDREADRLSAAGVISDAEQAKERVLETGDRYTVERMARQDPQRLKSMLDQTDAGGNAVHFTHLDALQRENAQREALAWIKAERTQADADLADLRMAQFSDFIERTVGGSDDPRGLPTHLEVAQSQLTGSQKIQAINLLNDAMDRKDLNRDNFAVLNDLGTRVLRGDLTDPMQILEHVGEDGITLDSAKSLVSTLEAMKSNPEVKQRNRLFEDAISGFKKNLAANPATSKADIGGQERFSAFRFEALRRFNNGIELGLTAEEMLDPANPKYILNPRTYLRTLDEGIEDMFQDLNLNGAPSVESGEVEPMDTKRRSGESWIKWLKRTGN